MEKSPAEISETVLHSFQSENGQYSVSVSIYDPPIYKASLVGYATIDDARETEHVLDASYDDIMRVNPDEKLYFIVDMESFKGTSWKAKMHFQNIGLRFFEEKNIAHITLVKPAMIVENMAYLVQKINPDFRLSVAQDEKQGLSTLWKLIENKSTTSSEASEDQLKADFLIRNGRKVQIVNNNEWNLQLTGDHTVQFYLLDNRVVLYREFGTSINMDDVPLITDTLKNIIDFAGGENLIFITDFSNLQFVSLKVRKAMAKAFYPFRPHWKFKYHIFQGIIKVMYYVYMQLDTSVKKDSAMVKNWQAALDHYMKLHYDIDSQRTESDLILETDYTSLSKKEMISLLLRKDEELSNYDSTQSQRIQELFHSISRISWDDDFEPSELTIAERDDPFAPLSNAISLLERDVYEIVSDLRYFNELLETKVLERTSELRNQNEELLKVNTELDSFVYKTSHDLRAPLVSVMGLVNIAKLEKDPDQKVKYLEMIDKSMNKLDGFIRDIIDFSRNARFQIELRDIDFNEMVESIWEDLDIVQMSRIEKRVNIGNSIPFRSDIIRLKMILSNLISNAIRYHREDHESPFVAVDVHIDNAGAAIKVEDNGQGIASVFIPQIFDMFYRASETSMGSGLGLYIVKEAVTKLNGSIEVESKVGEGSCFTIHLPHSEVQ